MKKAKRQSILFLLSLFFLALAACSDDGGKEADSIADGDEETATENELEESETEEPRDPFHFPEGFFFGAATAGFQVDMGCPTLSDDKCVDDQSDWYAYMTDETMLSHPRTFLSGDDPAKVGPGHWELYESDYDLAKEELHHNLFRMSIEWSRLFPNSTTEATTHEELLEVVDEEALATYHRMFDAMRARGLEPLVTLHHYTLPLWIHDGVACTLDIENCENKGWLDEEKITREIAKYAGFCAKEFGDRVDWWASLNEPFAVVLSGFLQPTETRSNPPALMLDAERAKAAMTAMIEAHARMVDAVREHDTIDADEDGFANRVGLVQAMAPVLPMDEDEAIDREAAKNIFYLWNLLFLDATALGLEDVELDATDRAVREEWTNRMDYIGLNYKMSMKIDGMESSFAPDLSPLLTLNPLTLDLSEVQPRGLYEMLRFLDDRYGVPVIITENNGQALWRDDIETEIDLVVKNLQWSLKAIEDGVELKGYVYWSFMDNIEWNHGAGIKLGLYAVDKNDAEKKRTPRATVPVFADIALENGINESLRNEHPVDFDEAETGGVPDANLFLE